MSETTTRKPILEWLQLSPGLLSASQPVAAKALPPAPPADPACIVASISARTVHAGGSGMVFYQPDPAVLGETTRAYRAPEGGATQRDALAEMTGYLMTGLQPR